MLEKGRAATPMDWRRARGPDPPGGSLLTQCDERASSAFIDVFLPLGAARISSFLPTSGLLLLFFVPFLSDEIAGELDELCAPVETEPCHDNCQLPSAASESHLVSGSRDPSRAGNYARSARTTKREFLRFQRRYSPSYRERWFQRMEHETGGIFNLC